MQARRIGSAGLAVMLSAMAGTAQATDVFNLEGYGAISRGMGGIAIASDVGPAGMMTNPATLSLDKSEHQIMSGIDIVTTDLSVQNTSTGETVNSHDRGTNRGPYIAPEAAYTQRIGDLTVGLGAFAQGGLGTEYGRNSFLSRANGGLNTGLDNSSRLLVLNVPFSLSYQVNDRLAIGGSVNGMWEGLNLNQMLGTDQVVNLISTGRATGSLVGTLAGLPALRGAHFSLTKNGLLDSGVDSYGISGKLGLTYQLTDSTRVGASYTLQSYMGDMQGRATLTAIDAIAGQIPLRGTIKILDFQMPSSASIGVSHALTPKVTVAFDATEVFWESVMKDIKVAFVSDSGGTLNVRLPQSYRDQTILSFGVAYQATDTLTLRTGFRYATQALRDSTLFAVIPATPSKHFSVGITYALSDASRIDLAYSHAFEERMDNKSLPNTSAPIHTLHSQNNAVLNFRYRF